MVCQNKVIDLAKVPKYLSKMVDRLKNSLSDVITPTLYLYTSSFTHANFIPYIYHSAM